MVSGCEFRVYGFETPILGFSGVDIWILGF